MKPEYPHGRFLFMRYDIDAESFFRLFFQRYTDSWRFIWRWRIAIGPFDLRRWVPYSEMCRLIAEHNERRYGKQLPLRGPWNASNVVAKEEPAA